MIKMKISTQSGFKMALIIWSVCLCSQILLAEVNVSAPGTLNMDGETYRLVQDITAGNGAFVITARNVTFDLNGHTITYNTSGPGTGIEVTGQNNTVQNGWILQGDQKSVNSPAISLKGKGHTVAYMGIKVNGIINGGEAEVTGIFIDNGYIDIHHVFIDDIGTTSDISHVPTCIDVDDRNDGNITIHDSYFVNAHVGVYFVLQGYNVQDPLKCQVYNNYFQHKRSPGTKAPYAVLLAKSRNVELFNNQIISDDARGLMIDGWGQGVERGSDYNHVHHNRIDVGYTVRATSGEYVENNIYGIRDRYSSGNNLIDNNIIIVDNKAGGITTGVYVGSDGTDPLMYNIVIQKNSIIVQDERTEDVSAVRYSVAEEVTVTENEFLSEVFSIGDYSYQNGGGITSLTEENNTPISIASYVPAAPTGLTLRKFFDSYLLTWDDNLDKGETQTYEYYVYRDGTKIDMSKRGGTFYVDNEVSGTHEYSVSAVNLENTEGPQSGSISTAGAGKGWSGSSSAKQVKTPTNLKIDK
jgi:hypothetical protein